VFHQSLLAFKIKRKYKILSINVNVVLYYLGFKTRFYLRKKILFQKNPAFLFFEK